MPTTEQSNNMNVGEIREKQKDHWVVFKESIEAGGNLDECIKALQQSIVEQFTGVKTEKS